MSNDKHRNRLIWPIIYFWSATVHTNPQIHQSTPIHCKLCAGHTAIFYDPTLNLRSKTTNTFVQKRKIQVWRVVQDGELYLQKMPAHQAWWANKLSNKLQLHPRDGFLDLQLRLTMISTWDGKSWQCKCIELLTTMQCKHGKPTDMTRKCIF